MALACVEICQAVSEKLGLRCVTGMEPENPGVGVYRDNHNDKVFLLPTAETASGMARALAALANLRLPFGQRRRDRAGGGRGLFAARHSPAGACRQERRGSRHRHVARQDRRQAVHHRDPDGGLGSRWSRRRRWPMRPRPTWR